MSDSTDSPTPDPDEGFVAIVESIRHVDDLRDRLRLITEVDRGAQELREAIRRLRRETLLEIRRTDPLTTWAELGELCGGVTAARAHQMTADD